MDKNNYSLQMKKMNLKKEFIIGIGVGIILTTIFLAFQLNNQTVNARVGMTIPEIAQDASLPKIPLIGESSLDNIVSLMLNSHAQWQTIEANAVTTFNDASWEMNIQLEQYGKGRGDYGPAGLEPEFSWISDGITLWKINLIDKAFEEYVLPDDVKSLESFGPTSLPTDAAESFIIRYPLDGIFPSQLTSFFFPHGLAQFFSQQQVNVLGSDRIAGRDAVIVELQVFDHEGKLVKKHKYWIDTSTGVILQSQIYTEATGWDKWSEQTTVTEIVYDNQFSEDAFEFLPAPDWHNVSSDN